MRTVINTIANDIVVANRAAIAVAADMGMGTVRVLNLAQPAAYHAAPRLHQGPSHKFGRGFAGKSKPASLESYSQRADQWCLPGRESTSSRLGRPFGGLGTA